MATLDIVVTLASVAHPVTLDLVDLALVAILANQATLATLARMVFQIRIFCIERKSQPPLAIQALGTYFGIIPRR